MRGKGLQVSEGVAKGAIVVLFTCTLLFCILFSWTAHAAGIPDTLPTPADYMRVQQEKLAIERALSEEISEMEDALAAARAENRKLAKEKDDLNDTQLAVLDSLVLDYAGEYRATAYCCERYPHICGGNGVTASGTVPTPGLTVAADWGVLPAGTWLYIEGIGLRRVEDRGSAIQGKRLDIAVDTHAHALSYAGQGRHHVWVLRFEGLGG